MTDLAGPVAVVGTGLLGTSVALACRRAGLAVLLDDISAENLRTATGLGAGELLAPADHPALVVVATPPKHLAQGIAQALRDYPAAIVTDVGSIKAAPLRELAGEPGLARYVGSHPMAGSERSGPLGASASLFDGRPWAITPHAGSSTEAIEAVTALALACRAVPTNLSPQDHDRAVARTSHLPHLAAVLVAGRLASAPTEHLALSGQGVRDVTRVAASSPQLWIQILAANSDAVLDVLSEVQDDLTRLVSAISSGDIGAVAGFLDRGNAGTAAIAGKHGGPARRTSSLFVSVPDKPGELARLFADAGASGVNIEDVYIDHDPGRPVGLTELVVDAERAEELLRALESNGWSTHR